MQRTRIMSGVRYLIGASIAALASAGVGAQETRQPQPSETLFVTATRIEKSVYDIPAAIDAVSGDELRTHRPNVDLSEGVGRIPGIVVQNRYNYAQDLQVSSRGFGARAAFGVRGIRLIADGIPATMPDGQGQAATFALSSAERIEVLRGPFSALYGNAAGGVIAVDTADGPTAPTVAADVFAGKYDTWRAATRLGGYNTLFDASRFESDGYREHSAVR